MFLTQMIHHGQMALALSLQVLVVHRVPSRISLSGEVNDVCIDLRQMMLVRNTAKSLSNADAQIVWR